MGRKLRIFKICALSLLMSAITMGSILYLLDSACEGCREEIASVERGIAKAKERRAKLIRKFRQEMAGGEETVAMCRLGGGSCR